MLNLAIIDQLTALHPNMRVQWRTRPTTDGWEAECRAGPDGRITPIWAAKGDTEQAALDTAVGHALHYWGWDLGRG
jgi:hypothetical protein